MEDFDAAIRSRLQGMAADRLQATKERLEHRRLNALAAADHAVRSLKEVRAYLQLDVAESIVEAYTEALVETGEFESGDLPSPEKLESIAARLSRLEGRIVEHTQRLVGMGLENGYGRMEPAESAESGS
ncbi:MAG: hypothetical protein MI920_20005 [Kiloniellales bacterium]|nr:hypothetical protein [Kiloniellales bacterium]